jgi:hypothetical protein
MVYISFWFMLLLMMIIYWAEECCKGITESLLVASKEIGLEVNACEAKHMVMARDQNAGRSQYKE